MRLIITLVAFVICGVGTAMAQTSTPAPASQPPSQGAVNSGRLSASEIRQLKAKAEGGDAVAESTLGKAYRDGNGVARDDAQALKWFRKAADQGDAEAENNLGTMYLMGTGVERDKEEAVRWYRKAAKQGNARAMFNMGASYYNGDGVTIDDVSSYAWFLLAKDAGYPEADDAIKRAESEKLAELNAAFVKIGQMYATGEGLPRDRVEALKWYRRAADNGDAEASVMVASLLLPVGQTPTSEESAEARQRCEAAAKKNFSPGAYCLAVIYRQGVGVAKDPVETAKWLERAAELRHPRAALELGEAYWRGVGVKPDPVTAYMWIWLALNSRVPGAERDEQALREEMSTKQVGQAKKKASDWAITHRIPELQRRPDNPPSK